MTSALSSPLAQRLLRIPPAYYVFGALLLTLWLTRPQLFNPNVMGIFIRQVAPLGILVLGQLLVMRVRSIDLSGAGVILLVNYIISSGLFPNGTLAFYLFMSIGIGLSVGLVNGVLVGLRRSSAVIVTLATNIILIGVVQLLASGKPPGDVPGFLRDIYNSKVLNVPSAVIIWVVLTGVLSIFLSRTVYGRYVESVGENPTAAHFSGVPVARTVVTAHLLAGVMAGLAGLVQTSSIAVGSIRFGLDLPLNAVAATILGGVIFGRGDGGVWGPFFGVMSFAMLFIVMTTFGIQEPGKLIAQGSIILIAAIFYGLRS
ncbi:MAG: ABC transporter permease [Marivivens sp.]|nr:ABC transporter permease [Marivivens sp.]